MPSETKRHAGSPDWFAMVGEVLVTAARAADLPADLNVSLEEHYIDGPEIAPGLFQGLRVDITNGVPSFRTGVRPGEVGDITIHVTAAVARGMNHLYASDPTLAQIQQAALANGQFRIEGDPSRLGAWFGATHDQILSRTAGSSVQGPAEHRGAKPDRIAGSVAPRSRTAFQPAPGAAVRWGQFDHTDVLASPAQRTAGRSALPIFMR